MHSRSVSHQACLYLTVLLLLLSLSEALSEAYTRDMISLAIDRRESSYMATSYPVPSSIFGRAEPSLQTLPEVYSEAVDSADGKTTTTHILIKLQALPEITSWRIYKTTQYERVKVQIQELLRTKDETIFQYAEFASYIIVEALDRTGRSLGYSRVCESIPPINIFTQDFIKERSWLQDAEPERPLPPSQLTEYGAHVKPDEPPPDTMLMSKTSRLLNPSFTFAYGAICGIAFPMLWKIRRSVLLKAPGLLTVFGPSSNGAHLTRKIY